MVFDQNLLPVVEVYTCCVFDVVDDDDDDDTEQKHENTREI